MNVSKWSVSRQTDASTNFLLIWARKMQHCIFMSDYTDQIYLFQMFRQSQLFHKKDFGAAAKSCSKGIKCQQNGINILTYITSSNHTCRSPAVSSNQLACQNNKMCCLLYLSSSITHAKHPFFCLSVSWEATLCGCKVNSSRTNRY